MDQIFKLTCSDGGHTGRSLALVSKGLQKLSAPWRRYSVLVSSPEKALSLLNDLGYVLISEQPINHLILMEETHKAPANATRGGDRDKIVTTEEIDTAHISLMQDLLALASPELQTLSLCSKGSKFAQLVCTKGAVFPRLRSLSLYHARKTLFARTPRLHADWAENTFPSLRRFHITANETLVGYFRHVVSTCGQLEQVCVTGSLDEVLGCRLEDVLLARPTSSARKDHKARLLTVALAASPYSYSPGSSKTSTYAKLCHYFETIPTKQSKDDVKVFVVSRSKRYILEEAIADWEDVVLGGTGVWGAHTEPPATK